ncbi:ACT domain-containing protein [Anaerobacterium chartisolvens]|uniref:UPF0237 protein DFR58_10326 n=1 Tax=Anaerobacterium chartisolvens TaxID=1297424 RepID=A0A369BCK7_9FIRM|nr:ACT domain-containing protein [Anaerobacterium chartisolvens]RCX19282.1 ACT domain-containing protein [Anaerobacterium chartisolvens]
MVKAVITVIGEDKVGIIAGISNILAKCNVNILDISQTIMHNVFTMVMMVDISEMCTDFASLSHELETKGGELQMTIRVQHVDIFKSMHRI